MKFSRTRRTYIIIAVNIFALYIFIFNIINRTVLRKTMKQVKLEMEWMNRGQTNQENSVLVQLVKDYYLVPPSTNPYNLEINQRNSTDGQGQLKILAPLLQKIKGGSFIECGAFDGEYISNTLWLEKELGWSGLLIEADPKSYAKLVTKNRKAWISNTCASQFVSPELLTFQRHPQYPVLTSSGKLNDIKNAPNAKIILGTEAKFDMQCIPLFTFLLALNQFTWDFFSLDTEGSELQILRTIPFDRVIFKIITIEANLIPEGSAVLNEFMVSKGYRHYRDVEVDKIYIHMTAWNELTGPNTIYIDRK